MSFRIEISPQAEKDLAWFRQSDRSLYIKCFDLTRAAAADPFGGIGKPEHLKLIGRNVWSRRVDLEHRMVYAVYDGFIVVAAYRYHYD